MPRSSAKGSSVRTLSAPASPVIWMAMAQGCPSSPTAPNACGVPKRRRRELRDAGTMTPGPDPAEIAGLLRLALTQHVTTAGTRRALPTLMHVGTPGVEEVVVAEEPGLDPG